MGNQVIFGIGEELLRLSIKYGYEKDYPKAWLEGGSKEERTQKRFMVRYNAHLFALLAEKLLLEEGVELLYDTKICGVDVYNGRINAVIVEHKGGREAISAKAFVDATGDADICSYAGENTALFGKNALAAWYYYYSKGKFDLLMQGVLDDPEGGSYSGGIKQTKLYSGLDAKENTEMLINSHKTILTEIINKKRNDPDYFPVTIPTIPQVRMTRRLAGAFELNITDDHKYFPDSIGLTGNWHKRGPVYEIPFGCLYGEKIGNLITAGRCISVTEPMWDITRVIPTCAVTGQAAGTAASLLETAFKDINIEFLQNKLTEQKVKLHIEHSEN